MAGIGISWGTSQPQVSPHLLRSGPAPSPHHSLPQSPRLNSESPPPRPIPAGASRALNLLFASIALFLILSLPFNPHAPEPNIFSLTRSRINTPIDVVFQRLSRLRPDSLLTDADVQLRARLTSLGARKVYLTFGPDALVSCQYCSFENLNTYLLYYLPFHVLLPHLLHLLILGLATSAPFAGRESARWRMKFTLAGLALAALDVWVVPPTGLYNLITLLRPLAFTVCDVICSIVVYLSSTNRFFFKPPSQADQLDQAVSAALAMLTGANNKLHAASVTRNAVVRDKALKARDDVYWRTMVAVENPTRGSGEGAERIEGVERVDVVNNIWDEEEVARAMSRAMAGQGGIDLAQLGLNANEFETAGGLYQPGTIPIDRFSIDLERLNFVNIHDPMSFCWLSSKNPPQLSKSPPPRFDEAVWSVDRHVLREVLNRALTGSPHPSIPQFLCTLPSLASRSDSGNPLEVFVQPSFHD
ncbi:uncharacterized protein N7482_002273 [Penicillium canariense]|uniref:Uncharacterized protein n=1 Tax=Penicillium canariense TaxID=189055 RepID=A0A9W9ILG3_9EURO|nr:uncharacterized protein N7482_002273 [Penicillium canariense]KAJ5176396.1 hypothetical protein N7482_002273 [Penicillium canariense]